jgi:hypothetical protein
MIIRQTGAEVSAYGPAGWAAMDRPFGAQKDSKVSEKVVNLKDTQLSGDT